MDVLITGSGFVGSNAARKFIDEGSSVTAVDLNTILPDYLESLDNTKLKMVKGDTTSAAFLEDIVKRERPRILVHTATYLNPLESFNVFEVNVRGTAVVLELARKYDLRLVYLSSGAIYGQMEGSQDIYEDEAFGRLYPPRDIDNSSGIPYSTSKRLGESWALMYKNLYGVEVMALRLGWVYGRGISDYRLNSGISMFLRKALVGDAVSIPYGGDTLCDYIYVEDAADAIYKAANVQKVKNFAYNIVYEKASYMKEVVGVVTKLIPKSSLSLGPGLWPSKGVPIPRGGISFPSNRHMNIERAKEDLGFAPRYDLEKGIAAFLGWMKKNWNICSPEAVPFKKPS